MRRALRVVILAAAAACGDDATMPDAPLVGIVDAAIPDAMPREVIMSTQSLMPLMLVEGIMTAGPGDVAVIELSAAADLGWNIHGHANGGTQVVYEERGVRAVAYTFAPTAMADWYLLVRNESQVNLDVMVRVELYGATQWRWQ